MRGAAVMWLAVSMASLAAAQEIQFKRTQLDATFRAEGVAVGDFNGDGRLDVAAGSAVYLAPDWKMFSIKDKVEAFDIAAYSDVFCCYAEDMNGDGRTDIVQVDQPGRATSWFANPGQPGAVWARHVMVPVTNNESPIYADVDGDGQRDLVAGWCPDAANPDAPERRTVVARKADDPTAAWKLQIISEGAAPGSQKYYHGLGVGDVNGDGRADVVTRHGWFEQPAQWTDALWPLVPAALGEDCAHMVVYDCDGDGDPDVISSSAHRYGVWWHERTADGWTTHTIDDTFSQTHAVELVDINGDGLKDFVTGKRFWAHGGHDPGAREPALLVWYELKRENGQPTWKRHTIDTDSGVGTQFEVADINGDKLPDVIISNKKGVYLFEQVRPSQQVTTR